MKSFIKLKSMHLSYINDNNDILTHILTEKVVGIYL